MSQTDDKDNSTKKEWIPIYQKRLPKAINYAKGSQSMAEFARKCGLNPMTLSRAVNGTIKKPLDKETIRVMAEKSDNPTDEVYEYLMSSNGWVKNDSEEKQQQARQRGMEQRKRYESVQNIIMRTLFENGHTIAPVFNTELEYLDHVLSRCRFPFYTDVRFALSVKGYEPEFLNYSVNVFTGSEFVSDRKRYKEELEDEFFFLMRERYKDVFLRDMWEPQAFENSLYSIVFVSKDLFEKFAEMLEGVSFNNSFSLILIDLDGQKVVEERFLPRRDGITYESLFKTTD